MKIEFGVQEYFNELKLMDAQYGQEEELSDCSEAYGNPKYYWCQAQ